MFGSILPPESDSLNKSWAQFESCTGIKISYEGSNDFESQLPVRVQGGTAPDLAIIPQPGLLQQMVALGAVKAPPAGVVANEDKYWNAAWKSYGSVNGTFYAAPAEREHEVARVVLAVGYVQGGLHDPDNVGPARSTV